ncbi:MAG: CBS domain-containing protein [Chloroflexi bacterium]|nr:MAG: CBS domain-containing protein [Chloroflexota bacterium]MBL1197208.1 CBS domain-containing protein [Chloroflexota bacterium]NOH14502.1 CBS domain-containing protein [Chloroflexota bacterium]
MSDEQSGPKLVRELMTVGVLTCPPETPIVDVTRLLLAKDSEGMVVLDEEGHAVGVVTRDELVTAYAQDDCETLTAENIMRADVPQLPPDIPLSAAAQIMQDQNLRVVFLMHHAGGIEYPAAILTYKHLLRHMAMQDEEDLSDLGIDAERQSPAEAFAERRDEARRKNIPSEQS